MAEGERVAQQLRTAAAHAVRVRDVWYPVARANVKTVTAGPGAPAAGGDVPPGAVGRASKCLRAR